MSRCRVIIDTDPGVDDAAALLMALASPELEVLGVTVVGGNVTLADGLANACRIVALSGRTGVPVHAGAPGPLVREQVSGKYAAIGRFREELVGTGSVAPREEHAVSFLVRQTCAAAAAGAPLTLCAIGPLTNIALALAHSPDVARGIARIVVMGGAFTALGNRAPWAEFNTFADPHAAACVHASGVPVVLFPLDATFQALFTATDFAAMRARGGAAGAALAGLLAAYDRSDPARFGRPGGPIHDAMTVAWLLAPELFTTRPAFIGVETAGETRGHSWCDLKGGEDRPARSRIVTGVDEAGFISLLTERIARYGDPGAIQAEG